MLAEVDAQREEVSRELRALEAAMVTARRLHAAREALSETWHEEPEAVQPAEFLTLAASPEEVRSAYRRHGARFEVDHTGELTLKMEVEVDGSVLGLQTTH